MEIKEIHNSKLAGLLKVGGITLYPYILYPNVPENSIRYHEFRHVLQIQKDGALRFYLRYLGEYLWGRVRGLSHDKAYRAISYEVEAYQDTEIYLKANNRIELLVQRTLSIAPQKKV